MRSLWLLSLVAGVALGQSIPLDPTVQKTFTNCSASGSVAQTIAPGTYLMTVSGDEDVWLCQAASASTCASSGTKFASGFAMRITITTDTTSASCRSTNATGDIQFTKAD
jgi:hypothetical protein